MKPTTLMQASQVQANQIKASQALPEDVVMVCFDTATDVIVDYFSSNTDAELARVIPLSVPWIL